MLMLLSLSFFARDSWKGKLHWDVDGDQPHFVMSSHPRLFRFDLPTRPRVFLPPNITSRIIIADRVWLRKTLPSLPDGTESHAYAFDHGRWTLMAPVERSCSLSKPWRLVQYRSNLAAKTATYLQHARHD